jgi:hypothetical protein
MELFLFQMLKKSECPQMSNYAKGSGAFPGINEQKKQILLC